MAKASTRKFDAVKGGDYQEPPYSGANALISTDSGDDGWAPHQVRRPLVVRSDSPGAVPAHGAGSTGMDKAVPATGGNRMRSHSPESISSEQGKGRAFVPNPDDVKEVDATSVQAPPQQLNR
jgi:hypothetical protein